MKFLRTYVKKHSAMVTIGQKITMGIFVIATLFSVVSVAQGYYGRSFWPWRQTFYIFMSSSDHVSTVMAYGQLEDGSDQPIDLRQWFRYPMAFETTLADEVLIYRRRGRQLSDFVCSRYNEQAVPGQRLKYVSLWIAAWETEVTPHSGRTTFLQAKENDSIRYFNLNNQSCPIGANIL